MIRQWRLQQNHALKCPQPAMPANLLLLLDAERCIQLTRRITRASAAAAALAAADASPDQFAEEQTSGATAALSQPTASNPAEAEPSSNAEEPTGSFVARREEMNSPAAETSGEVQGVLRGLWDDACELAPDNANTAQQTPGQQAVRQDSAEMMSQTAPSWRRLEARMEGVLPIWSIFKRFGRRPQPEQ